MQEKEEYRVPAGIEDDNYDIVAMSFAPLNLKNKSKNKKHIELTGKDNKAIDYGKDNVISADIREGMVITVEEARKTEKGRE